VSGSLLPASRSSVSLYLCTSDRTETDPPHGPRLINPTLSVDVSSVEQSEHQARLSYTTSLDHAFRNEGSTAVKLHMMARQGFLSCLPSKGMTPALRSFDVGRQDQCKSEIATHAHWPNTKKPEPQTPSSTYIHTPQPMHDSPQRATQISSAPARETHKQRMTDCPSLLPIPELKQDNPAPSAEGPQPFVQKTGGSS